MSLFTLSGEGRSRVSDHVPCHWGGVVAVFLNNGVLHRTLRAGSLCPLVSPHPWGVSTDRRPGGTGTVTLVSLGWTAYSSVGGDPLG